MYFCCHKVRSCERELGDIVSTCTADVHRARLTGTLADERALYDSRPAGRFTKDHFRDYRILLHHRSTRNTETVPCRRIVFDDRPTALAADRLGEKLALFD